MLPRIVTESYSNSGDSKESHLLAIDVVCVIQPAEEQSLVLKKLYGSCRFQEDPIHLVVMTSWAERHWFACSRNCAPDLARYGILLNQMKVVGFERH